MCRVHRAHEAVRAGRRGRASSSRRRRSRDDLASNTCAPLASLIATLWGTPSSRLWNRARSARWGDELLRLEVDVERRQVERPAPRWRGHRARTGVGSAAAVDGRRPAAAADGCRGRPAARQQECCQDDAPTRIARTSTPRNLDASRSEARAEHGTSTGRNVAGAHGSRTHRATPGAAPPVLKTGEPTGTPPLPRNGDRSPFLGRPMIGR